VVTTARAPVDRGEEISRHGKPRRDDRRWDGEGMVPYTSDAAGATFRGRDVDVTTIGRGSHIGRDRM
jgi:hypothetical protein